MGNAQSRIEVYRDEEKILSSLREDVRKGLSTRPRSLPPKYFYDERGSDLFEEITRLPEYYLTRSEISILEERAREILERCRPVDLVELGPGSSQKSRVLLDAALGAGRLARFVPVDISAEALEATAADLARDYPSLEIHGIAAEFEEALDRIPRGGPRLVAFLGSTIGNLDRPAAVELLRRVARLLEPEDRFLLGTDLVKEVPALEAAYNDSAGVTARFNRNILAVINRRLRADFNPDRFDHIAFFDSRRSRIEMHLRAREAHTVRIADLRMAIRLEEGETIHTENSYKYTREMVTRMLSEAGLKLEQWFIDARNTFALSLSGRTT